MLTIAAHTLQPELHPLAPTKGPPSVPLTINGPEGKSMSLYLDGRLQYDNGYDIAEPHGGELTIPTPENPVVDERCLVLLHDRLYPVRARVVMWYTPDRTIGLVAYEDDHASIAYARKAAAKRQPFI